MAAIRAEGRRSYGLKTIVLSVLSVLIVSGCAMLGPDYQEPAAPVESDWIETGDTRINSEQPVDPKWWHTAFQDPVLDRLIDTALQQNLTLRSAGLRVLLADNAILVLPSAPGAAPIKALNREETVRYRNRALGILCIAGLGYLPQLSIPAAVSEGAPLGISLVGAPGSDRMLLAVASSLGART